MKLQRNPTHSSVKRLVEGASFALFSAALVGSLLLTSVEWCLVPAEEGARLATVEKWVLLPLLMGSGWFLGVLGVSLLLAAVPALQRKLVARSLLAARLGVGL